MTDTKDRRVLRTRESLHHALINLVLEKGYEAVTIQEIIERANVGRSTFYLHFTSKEDLLTSGMKDLRNLLMEHQQKALSGTGGIEDRSLGFSRALFEHVHGYRDIYRALVGERSSTIVISRMRTLLTELVREDLAAIGPKNLQEAIPLSVMVDFIVGGLLAVLTWWLDRRAELQPEQVDIVFRSLAIPSISASLNK
jgi:AcrR family transcriptional regulator